MEEDIRLRIKESYNKNSKYRETDEIIGWKLPLIDAFTEYTSHNNLHNVLDLGAGSGSYAKIFSDYGLDVTCIDASEEMIKLCLNKGLDAELMDFYDMCFPDDTFDAIWSMNTLLHVPKRSLHSILEGVSRILKRNGVFFIGIYGGESSEGIFENDFYRPKRYFSRYTDEELKSILKEYFQIIKFEHIDIGKNEFWFQSVFLKCK